LFITTCIEKQCTRSLKQFKIKNCVHDKSSQRFVMNAVILFKILRQNDELPKESSLMRRINFVDNLE